MFTKVLLALDGSSEATAAIPYARAVLEPGGSLDIIGTTAGEFDGLVMGPQYTGTLQAGNNLRFSGDVTIRGG